MELEVIRSVEIELNTRLAVELEAALDVELISTLGFELNSELEAIPEDDPITKVVARLEVELKTWL